MVSRLGGAPRGGTRDRETCGSPTCSNLPSYFGIIFGSDAFVIVFGEAGDEATSVWASCLCVFLFLTGTSLHQSRCCTSTALRQRLRRQTAQPVLFHCVPPHPCLNFHPYLAVPPVSFTHLCADACCFPAQAPHPSRTDLISTPPGTSCPSSLSGHPSCARNHTLRCPQASVSGHSMRVEKKSQNSTRTRGCVFHFLFEHFYRHVHSTEDNCTSATQRTIE